MFHQHIFQTRDPDFLNDGALQATPLNIVLSGPSGPYQQPRYMVLSGPSGPYQQPRYMVLSGPSGPYQQPIFMVLTNNLGIMYIVYRA